MILQVTLLYQILGGLIALIVSIMLLTEAIRRKKK